MEKSIGAYEEKLSEIRAGRANPAILNKIRVDYYGTPTPINQVAGISVPEARLIVIQPWDISLLKEIEKEILKAEIVNRLKTWNKEDKIMFKFTIPTVANHYLDLYDYECVVRIVALSGGYDIDKAVELLAKNNRMIASFSRALLQDLNANQSQEEFDQKLHDVIVKIYDASIS